MPRNRKAWAAWNYHDFTPSSKFFSPEPRVSLTANLNDLPGQDLSITDPILTTLNPCRLPDASLIQRMFYYRHPIFDDAAKSAQNEMPKVQGKRGIWFAGAWMGYGFHEDGFRTGIEAARGICPEIELPFEIVDWKTSAGKEELMRMWDRKILGFWIMLVQRLIVLWGRFW
jgi:predicted NAD/FAD-binding protein